MITFFVCLACLVFGNFLYGKFLERKFGVNANRETPLNRLADGVDYVAMPTWKMFVIQLLNIAGLGPIFGAIMGVAFGPMAFVWIVLGNILFGSMYDYIAGMISLRGDGRNVPDIIGYFLGKWPRRILMVVTMFLLLVTGASFIVGPVDLLNALTGLNRYVWMAIIIAYYMVATILPINQIIGRIYPYFGMLLLFMAVAVGAMMLVKAFGGEITMVNIDADSFRNMHFNPEKYRLIPMIFVVMSCGALSGFHATQSPLLARCMTSELQGRKVFHAAMVVEGIIALIWASASIAYFGGVEALNEKMAAGIPTAVLVNEICQSWLGKLGSVLAVLGIIVCPITTGDTALRSSRLILADTFKIDQKSPRKRFLLALPAFAIVLTLANLKFESVWVLVGIANQILSTMMLWAMTMFFKQKVGGYSHFIASIPATLMTFVVVSFIIVAPYENGGLALDITAGRIIGAAVAIATFAFFLFNTGIKSYKA